MTALKIKYLKGAFTVFALCLIGTVSAAPNGNGDEKEEKKEVKVETAKMQVNMWFNVDAHPSSPNQSTVLNQGNSDPDCDESAGTLCGVELSYTSNSQIEALLDRIESEENLPSVQEFIDAGASITNSAYKD